MKKILLFLAVSISGFLTAQNPVTKNLGDYTTLKVYNGIELELIQSDENKVEITRKKAEKVRIKNVNDILKIYLPFSLKPNDNAAEGEVLVKLFYNKPIQIIDGNEGATITGKDITQEKLVVKTQERAFINLTVSVKNLEVKAISGGIVKLTGTTENQEVNADLYGIYHGFALETAKMSIVKSGTGAKAEVFAGETLNAKVSFGGSIFYKGTPKIAKNKKVISGIIKKRSE